MQNRNIFKKKKIVLTPNIETQYLNMSSYYEVNFVYSATYGLHVFVFSTNERELSWGHCMLVLTSLLQIIGGNVRFDIQVHV